LGAVLGLIFAMPSAGCAGGSPNDNTGTRSVNTTAPVVPGTQSLAEGRFLLSAGSICDASWARMLISYRDYRQKYSSKMSNRQLFANASQEVFLPSMLFWPDDIGYLAIPEEDAKQIKAMLAAMQQAVDSGQEQRVSSPKRFAAIFNRSNRLARRYGLHSCTVTESSFDLS